MSEEEESINSTGTKYSNEIFEHFEKLTSKSQYEKYYETHEVEGREEWKPSFHQVTDLSSESDCNSCIQLEEEIKLYKYFGIGRFNKALSKDDQKCKCAPQIALLTPADEISILSIPENRHEPNSVVKAEFVCDDQCSLKEEDIRDEIDEPAISGIDYFKYYREKLKYDSSSYDWSSMDSASSIYPYSIQDDSDESDFANPTETCPKHGVPKVIPKIISKKIDIKHPPPSAYLEDSDPSNDPSADFS